MSAQEQFNHGHNIEQSLSERSQLTEEAKKIGINAITPDIGFQRALSEVSTLLLMDLSASRKGRMVMDVCKKLNIDPKDVLLVWASPPCDTYSKLGPVNISRGNHTRDFSDPSWPPRKDDSIHSKRAAAAALWLSGVKIPHHKSPFFSRQGNSKWNDFNPADQFTLS